MSYFEWLKNLSHVRFGRLVCFYASRYSYKMNRHPFGSLILLQNKKWEETSKKLLLDFVETTVNRKLGDVERNLIIHGADEVDIVRSGLDDTMTTACAETRKSALEKVSVLPRCICYLLLFRTPTTVLQHCTMRS